MRVSVAKRLVALEARFKPVQAAGNLNDEIRAMTALERNHLRDFLLFLKGGGQPCDAVFENLKLAAEAAVMSARQRLNAA